MEELFFLGVELLSASVQLVKAFGDFPLKFYLLTIKVVSLGVENFSYMCLMNVPTAFAFSYRLLRTMNIS